MSSVADVPSDAVKLIEIDQGQLRQHVDGLVRYAVEDTLNSLLDAGLGWIPVVGDLFDAFFKADTRNVRLLQAYAGRVASPPCPRPLPAWGGDPAARKERSEFERL